MAPSSDTELDKRVCVLGSGAAGLVTAHVLLKDGFRNVEVVSRDRSAGGVWRDGMVYPGLTTNNVVFEYSSLPISSVPSMTPPVGRNLTGEEMTQYLETFAERFLKGRIRYLTEVTNVRRSLEDGVWTVSVVDLESGERSELRYDKVVLCSGGCHTPQYPTELAPEVALKAGFRGRVLHTSALGPQKDQILEFLKSGSEPGAGRAVVIGGGKSAQDAATFLARRGRKVSIILEQADAILASRRPLPPWIRRSRFTAMLTPTRELRYGLQRFLHTTWLGSCIVKLFWSFLTRTAYSVLQISKDSPLRNTYSLFWSRRISDEGVGHPDGFHAQVRMGNIELIAPARASHFDANGIVLSDGRSIKADAVFLGTGYQSSWDEILDSETREELGLTREPISINEENDEWAHYLTLANPPIVRRQQEKPVTHAPTYRGVVPAKNILRHDFVIAGAVYTTNTGYSNEVIAHWIASYLRKDPFLRLPTSISAAKAEAERNSRWIEKRYPGALDATNESYSADLLFAGWPVGLVSYFEDMRLPSFRSGGNWFDWPFKVIETSELERLTEERAVIRAESVKIGAGS